MKRAINIVALTALLTACTSGTMPKVLNAPAATLLNTSSLKCSLLYSFGGYAAGFYPQAALIDVSGTFYGTTYGGQTLNYQNEPGTVFSITSDGTEQVLDSFSSIAADGSNPAGALIYVKGELFSTTSSGGARGDGTVFKITTGGTENVLHSFKGSPTDGSSPVAALIYVNGTFYGTTSAGGESNYGTVFSLTATGKEKVLYSFKGGPADGSNPQAELIYLNGKLYGTTLGGGASKKGTVFTVTTAGTEKVLHSFRGASTDGAGPQAPLIYRNGKFYGTTYGGGASHRGTVFSITTSGRVKVLHNFAGGSADGAGPAAALIDVNGTFYGTTSGSGTVFSITSSGTEKVLYSFSGRDGNDPAAPLIYRHGEFYGTTLAGGASDYGTVFECRL